ncbi:MAG TPA: hypothetical protein VFB31_19530 [Pseudolabrys sp.]|nr:hypothetical protein [Pseudolabrys sp.]
MVLAERVQALAKGATMVRQTPAAGDGVAPGNEQAAKPQGGAGGVPAQSAAPSADLLPVVSWTFD